MFQRSDVDVLKSGLSLYEALIDTGLRGRWRSPFPIAALGCASQISRLTVERLTPTLSWRIRRVGL